MMSHILRASQVCILLFLLSGCADRAQIQRRSIADLYQDAVESTARIDQESRLIPPGSVVSELAPTQWKQDESQNIPVVTQPFPAVQTNRDIVQASHTPDTKQSPAKLPSLAVYDAPNLRLQNLDFLGRPNYGTQAELASGQGPVMEALPYPPGAAKLITEFFDQTEIRDAIQFLAEVNGDEVVLDESVGGLVSMEIKNATFSEALEMILMPLGYVFAMHDGKYIIAPPDPSSPLFRYVATRATYEPISHSPSKLMELIPDRYDAFYQASDERNLIVIEAPEHISAELIGRLQELDQPVRQVVLEAIVCVTAPESGFRFGMDWNHALAIDGADRLKIGLSGLAFSGSASPYGIDNAFSDFAVTSAFVQLLSQQGYVTIRAQPRVTAKDGEKASISISRETFFSLQPTSSNVFFRQDVQKVDAGISLEITPHIRGDMVSVEIERAEVSEDIRTNDPSPEANQDTYPIINRRLVSTKVDVRDGETIVIGGLVQRQTVDRVNSVPFLGSLPGVGPLFRTVEKQEQDAEVAIFISPRIVPLHE